MNREDINETYVKPQDVKNAFTEESNKNIREAFKSKAKIMLKNAQDLFNNPNVPFSKKKFTKQVELWGPHAGYSKIETQNIIEKIHRLKEKT